MRRRVANFTLGSKLVAYAQRNKDFVLVTALVSGGFETDGVHKFVEIVNDALIEAVELRTFLLV